MAESVAPIQGVFDTTTGVLTGLKPESGGVVTPISYTTPAQTAASAVAALEQAAVTRALSLSHTLWYPKNDLSNVFQDAAGTTMGAYNLPVGLLQDARGYSPASAASTARPTLVQLPNGNAAISFDGVDDVLASSVLGGNFVTGSQGTFMCAVFNANSAGTIRALIGSGAQTGTAAGARLTIDSSNAILLQSCGGSTRVGRTSAAVIVPGRMVVAGNWDVATNSVGFINNVSGTPGSSQDGTSTTTIQLGATNATNYCDRIIAGWLYSPTKLTAADMEVYQRFFEARLGLFATKFFLVSQLVQNNNIPYSTRVNKGLQFTSVNTQSTEQYNPILTMLMDVYVPPNATATNPAPMVVYVHGGGLQAGDKGDVASEAATWGQAGFVVANINYRLLYNNQATPALRKASVIAATEDLQNAIRFLKKNAAVYKLDPNRIVTVGKSSGGSATLSNAMEADTLINTVNDYLGYSSKTAAQISTGAQLHSDVGYSSDDFISYNAADTPCLLYHALFHDGTSNAYWTDALDTINKINASGNICVSVQTPDEGHTVPLDVEMPYWPTTYAFVKSKLNL